MQKQPLVSIIVPVYNVEKYLRQCVESICSQSYKNIEVILVDDGSNDESPRICDEYMKKDKRIHVIHKRKEGVLSARDDGIKKATGEYVQFVDSDDWLAPDITEKMVEAITEYQSECVICGHYMAGETLYPEKQMMKAGYYEGADYVECILSKIFQMKEDFCFGIDPSVWAKLFIRVKVMKYILEAPKSITFGEDAAVTYPYLLNACKSVYIIGEHLYYYRQNPDSMTKLYSKVQTKNTIELLKYLRAVGDKNIEVDFNQQLDYYTLVVALWVFSNEKKGGWKYFLRRYRKLQEFIRETDLKKCIKRTDLSLLNRKNRMELLLILHGGGAVLFAILILRFKVKK